MKAVLNLIIVIAALAGLGWTLQRGFTHLPEAEEEHAAEPADKAKDAEPEAITVELTKEQIETLDIRLAAPTKAQLKPQRQAFGHVLDPAPLLALVADLDAAESALTLTKSERERALALGLNTSAKATETAQAQFRADTIKLSSLKRSATLAWGKGFADLDAAARDSAIDNLIAGETALVRADALPGEAISELPSAAKVLVLGREDQPLTSTSITPAPDTDASTQAQGFILRIDKPAFALRPGTAVTAYLELAGETREGVIVPRSAIVRHDGQTWVYVRAEEEGHFEREAVTLLAPQADGWFVAEGIEAKDQLVTQGAATLLSQELKAAGGLEEE
jgi:hypothetical protein